MTYDFQVLRKSAGFPAIPGCFSPSPVQSRHRNVRFVMKRLLAAIFKTEVHPWAIGVGVPRPRPAPEIKLSFRPEVRSLLRALKRRNCGNDRAPGLAPVVYYSQL
jgi:hypothetical protein